MTKLPGWWVCPQTECAMGGLHDSTQGQIVYCSGCDHAACYDCKVPWHPGIPCAERQQELKSIDDRKAEKAKEEEAAAQVLERTTKICPEPKCGVRIEKNAGCQHMTCKYSGQCVPQVLTSTGRQCRHGFCWDCLARWSSIMQEGNTAHDSKCPWHTSNLRERRRE